MNLDMLKSLVQDLFKTDLAEAVRKKKPIQNISEAKTLDDEFHLGKFVL